MLILKDTLKLVKNAISKNPIISKVFLEKVLELSLCYYILSFKKIFILIIVLNHYFIDKWDGKKDFIRQVSLSNFKIIFILLAKMIVI